ncbi:UNVERIFIED_CONTAM: Calcium-dependent protein kinase [Sesamum radiatum]|uniref:non-specific serine/threonine protein kinase n=1 Tax=Sesamum radiatum TaxID=300843 RepID=A0AAW2R590_SESRA
MGNNCVYGKTTADHESFFHAISRCLSSSSASPAMIIACNDNKGEAGPNPVHVNPPQLSKIEREEIKPTHPTTWDDPIKNDHVRKSSQVIMVVTSNPAKKTRHHNVKRAMTLGLQVESVIRTKTGHLKEHFTLGEKLGHGQFGKTFLCVERQTGKKYACKSIAKRRLLSMEDLDDVRREIEIMQLLSGRPNIVSIKGAYEDSVAVNMVMELCTGGELYDRIVKRGRYPERKAAEFTRTIFGVIETCHSLGVMHRDLKPENFLFVNEDEDSPIKAIDFGLSVSFKPGESFSDVVGSPYYVAPEVLCQCYGAEADVWSAGVIVYILLCGVPPFWGESEQELFEEIMCGEIDFRSDPWPNISENAKDIVKKMLVRDPKRRITAHQVLCKLKYLQVILGCMQVEGVALDCGVLSQLSAIYA